MVTVHVTSFNDLPSDEQQSRQAVTWAAVRRHRDDLLLKSDWAVIPDSPHDTQELRAYRQTLRDIPQTFATPDEVVWPANPLEAS